MDRRRSVMRHAIFLIIACAGALWAVPGQAVTLRYALVIGNNIGVDYNGKQPFPKLSHAEREALRVKDSLVEVANFDKSERRTKLLVGTTREEVKNALASLADQLAEDRRLFGAMQSIFLLYFTGHGLEGRLLFEDGPLTSKQIATLFNTVNADLSVGVFDACYAGSLNSALVEKGLRPTPGLNVIDNLPRDVLSARGSIWYTSSGSNEPSYEDKTLGGVFTHYFVEALKHAKQDGPGITLDSIWRYAQHKTVTYTSQHDRRQVPEQLVAKLRSKLPIYFSFPVPRDATLVLTEPIEGTFALSYANGAFVEVFEKRPGMKQVFSVYSGDAKLMLLDATPSGRKERAFTLRPGETLVLKRMPAARAPAGRANANLLTKGIWCEKNTPMPATRIAVTRSRLQPSRSRDDAALEGLAVGAGYGFTRAAREMLHPSHRFFLPLRLHFRSAYIDVRAIYGIDRRSYDGWGYTVQLAGGAVLSGYALRLKALRFNFGVGGEAGHTWQSFDTATGIGVQTIPRTARDKRDWQIHITGHVGATLWAGRRFVASLIAELGPLFAPGSAVDERSTWHIAGGISLLGYYRMI